MYLPKLYKKTATGAIQEWLIGTEGTTIVTHYGQVGGKIQTTKDSVKSGKNQGRKNATEVEEQAQKEALAKWTKQKKSGYVESLEDAEYGKTDSIITGGVVPMLAKVFEDHESKITFPCYIQPKLDGHRCIAVVKDGKCTLWSRTRKPITSVPHISEQIEMMCKKNKIQDLVLDGEIYSHELRNDFEKLTSISRKQEESEDSKLLQYHIYDAVMGVCYSKRAALLLILENSMPPDILPVETLLVDSVAEISDKTDHFLDQGFEGSMVRLLGIPYEHKRSHQLLKVKTFVDAEFTIIGAEEGRGKLQGHCGAFVCSTGPRGKVFKVKMSGETEKLKEYWEDRLELVGQKLTVKYQGLTKDGIPRFPVGLRIREDL